MESIKKEELSDFDPIEIEIKEKPKSLDLKIRKVKGEVKNISLLDKDIDKEIFHLYREAKELEPTEKIPNPYWNIYYLISPISMYSPGTKYNKTSEVNKKWISGFSVNLAGKTENKILSYSPITGILNYFSHDFFQRFSNLGKPENALFIFSLLHMTSVEEYIVYREKKSIYSYRDKYYCLELPYFVSEEKEMTDPEKRRKLMKTFSKINYQLDENNICNPDKFRMKIEDPLDLICIDVSYFLWKSKKYYSYINSQALYNLIVFCFKKLRKNGNMKISIGEINSQITVDIIGILSYYFEEVSIFRSPQNNILSPYKYLLCKKFKNISEEELEKLNKISYQWNKLSEHCNLDIIEFNKDKYYLSSILNYKGNYPSITKFNNAESIKKMRYFNKIVSVYNDIKICGEDVIQNFKNKKLANSIYYLKKNNIDVNIAHKQIDNEILKDDFSIDFNNTKFGMRLKSKESKKIKINIKEEVYDLTFLQKQENNLKFTKRILDTFEGKRWKEVTSYTKKLSTLKKEISEKYVELDVSQAFLKLYEVLETYDLIPKENSSFRSFHFCEFPGQFILSTNHYIMTKTKIKEHYWTGQSLNPRSGKNQKYRNQKIFGDKYGLYRNYPENWDFGPDNSGDITKTKNMKYYKKILEQVDLVTSDCGLDMTESTKAVYQDKEMSYINFCQVLMVLNGLKKESHYVGKIYLPQTTTYVVGMNYILSQCFKEIYIHKSALNAGSSEVYIVCKFFQGVEKEIVDKLFEIKNNLSVNKTFVDIPKEFLEEYSKVMSFFAQRNDNHIQRNIYYYENPSSLINPKKIESIHRQNSSNWIKFYKFR